MLTSVFISFKEMQTEKGAIARIALGSELIYCRYITCIK
jgi:hypothetical protein